MISDLCILKSALLLLASIVTLSYLVGKGLTNIRLNLLDKSHMVVVFIVQYLIPDISNEHVKLAGIKRNKQ